MLDTHYKSVPTIRKEFPDTVWLKNKRGKKIKEGKDYILNYAYKGIRDGDKFVTPTDSICNKAFGLLDVTFKTNLSYIDSFELRLLDYDTTEPIFLTIDKSFSDWKIYSCSTRNLIKNWIDTNFYKKSSNNYKDTYTPSAVPNKI